MKRTFNTIQNTNNSNVKPNAVLEGVVVAVTEISDSQGDKKGKYWTALVCDSNQNINRITKYLSLRTTCSLHGKIVEYLNNQTAIKLNKLKYTGDNLYTATNETIAAPKEISFTPLCTQISSIEDIQSMSEGQYVSFSCKIIDIGPDDAIVFNNGQKRVQKLKRTTIVADKTGSINMNIWQNQFDLIKKDLSYTIKLAKVKIFNYDTSIITTIHTTFQPIEDIEDINCSDAMQVSYESTITGKITSIALVEQRSFCPKCYSTDVQRNDKTIRCITCKSRSIYTTDSLNQNEIQLNIINSEKNVFELIVNISKLQALLQQCDHLELCKEDLIEKEDVLLALSSINVCVNFDTKNKHINNIVMSDIENQLNESK